MHQFANDSARHDNKRKSMDHTEQHGIKYRKVIRGMQTGKIHPDITNAALRTFQIGFKHGRTCKNKGTFTPQKSHKIQNHVCSKTQQAVGNTFLMSHKLHERGTTMA